nr:conserved hypothetical protein [Xanthomonas citri pv. citri]
MGQFYIGANNWFSVLLVDGYVDRGLLGSRSGVGSELFEVDGDRSGGGIKPPTTGELLHWDGQGTPDPRLAHSLRRAIAQELRNIRRAEESAELRRELEFAEGRGVGRFHLHARSLCIVWVRVSAEIVGSRRVNLAREKRPKLDPCERPWTIFFGNGAGNSRSGKRHGELCAEGYGSITRYG